MHYLWFFFCRKETRKKHVESVHEENKLQEEKSPNVDRITPFHRQKLWSQRQWRLHPASLGWPKWQFWSLQAFDWEYQKYVIYWWPFRRKNTFQMHHLWFSFGTSVHEEKKPFQWNICAPSFAGKSNWKGKLTKFMKERSLFNATLVMLALHKKITWKVT